jgi:hypothetical protein
MNPIGTGGWYGGFGALENPLSGGELATAAVTATLGFLLSDAVDRYLSTTALATTSAGQQAESAVNMRVPNAVPDMTRIGAGIGMVVVPFIGAHFVKSPMGRASLQGAGLGAGVRLLAQLFKSYVVQKFLPTNATVQRLYQDTLTANSLNASDLALQATAGKAGSALAGRPRMGVGAADTYVAPSLLTKTLVPATSSVAAPVLSPQAPATPPAMTYVQTPISGSTISQLVAQQQPPTQDFPPPPVPQMSPSAPVQPCSLESVGQSVARAYDTAKASAGMVNGLAGVPALPNIDQLYGF